MIVVLKNADFSANNLGKIQVTTELHAYTKAAISASGNTNLTSEQKSALNSLFLTMGVDGSNNIMSKVKKMYLPVIASDLSKALVDYSTDTFAVDATPSATNWQMRNKGIASTDSAAALTSNGNFGLVANNVFMLMERTEKYTASGTQEGSSFGTIWRGSTTNKFIGILTSESSAGTSWNHGSYGADWGGSYSEPENELRCDCINNSTSAYDYYAKGVWNSSTSKTPSADTSTDTACKLYHFGIGNACKKAVGVSILGEALTTEQAKAVVTAVETLVNTFGL